MILYSQRSAEYGALRIGSTNIEKNGCVVMSLATLFQVDPKVIIQIPYAINSRGECDISVVAMVLGGKIAYRGKKAPTGWCMAKTGYYMKVGVPTHFFPYNPQTKECIDPLQNPTARQQNIYPISEYISIDGIKLDFTKEDLERKLKIAEKALDRVTGLRKSALDRFIDRIKSLLYSLR